jgi:hypothetical protein
MKLFYDRLVKMFTLLQDEVVIFLGPMTHSLLRLEHEFGLTNSQAREAVLRAMFNMGDSVCIDNVKRMASLIVKKDQETKENA